jgi:hypothetical protein
VILNIVPRSLEMAQESGPFGDGSELVSVPVLLGSFSSFGLLSAARCVS